MLNNYKKDRLKFDKEFRCHILIMGGKFGIQ